MHSTVCWLWLKNGKRIIDDGGAFGALSTDLSKAFHCITHDFSIAKLKTYGFHIDAIKLIHNCLSNRKQRVKIKDPYSSWKDISYGVPQGSMLSPFLFKIYLCDLFYFLGELNIASYADDTAIYIANKKI